MYTKPSLRSLTRPENAKSILRYLMTDGTKWLKLFGAIILLFADVWLGAQVFQWMGMDGFSSYMLAGALSALQIALFQSGGKILTKASTTWQHVWALVVIIIGWLTVIADSFIDGSAAFVKVGTGLPNTWRGIMNQLRNPYVLIVFCIFFILSFLGERLGRLAIYGEHDEEEFEEHSHVRPSAMSPREASSEVVSEAIEFLRKEHPAG